MTLIPIWKTCPNCHKKYSWNPDVGQFSCPNCHGLGNGKTNVLKKLFGGKR